MCGEGTIVSKKDVNKIRTISDEFLKALKYGVLKELTEIVKNSDDLIMCFRDEYINIYYKSHSLFKVVALSTQFNFEFNLGHARYTDTYENTSKLLSNYGVVTKHTIGSDKNGNETNTYNAKIVVKKDGTINNLNSIVALYKRYIDDFFDTTKTYDFFKKDNDESKTELLEKVRQQEIFSKHMNFTGRGAEWLFYDMELSIPNQSKTDDKKGSPDCMAVKLVDGILNEVVLVEVKSNSSACNGNNGIKKHYIDFNKIISNNTDKENLYKAMKNAIKYYSYLGMIPDIAIGNFDENVKFSIHYIFTDDAINWAENKRQTNKNYEYFKKISAEQITLGELV